MLKHGMHKERVPSWYAQTNTLFHNSFFFFIELLLYFELNKEEFPVLDKKCSLWLWLEITDGIDLVIILLALQFAH